MDLGAIVEVAIGLIFVWIVLSLATIQIQEWISTRLDRRAKDLESSLHEMLANPNLKAQFYDHPVIRGLTANKRRKPSETPRWYYKWPIVKGFTREKRKLPSYIPAQQFATALFDIAMTAGTESSIIQQGILKIRDDLHANKSLTVYQAVIQDLNLLSELARSAAASEANTGVLSKDLPNQLKQEARNFLANFEKKHPKLKLDEKVKQIIQVGIDQTLAEAPKIAAQMKIIADQQPDDPDEPTLAKVRRGVAALSVISPEINQSLNALLSNVEEYITDKEKALAKARGNVERWYDDAQDRVSGAFKRYSQWVALLVGFVLALILNVDSLDLTFYLWAEPAVRTALAQKANSFELPQAELQENPQQAMENFRNQFSGLSLPVGWSKIPIQNPSECMLVPSGDGTFGIPIPWNPTECLASPQPSTGTNIWLKMAGIFITALAARQGAPFWFDILKKAANLRGTGANPIEKAGAR
jgi:hypothetical protein